MRASRLGWQANRPGTAGPNIARRRAAFSNSPSRNPTEASLVTTVDGPGIGGSISVAQSARWGQRRTAEFHNLVRCSRRGLFSTSSGEYRAGLSHHGRGRLVDDFVTKPWERIAPATAQLRP